MKSFSRSARHRVLWPTAVAAAVVATTAACGGGAGATTSGQSAGTPAGGSSAASDQLVSALPSNLQQLYSHTTDAIAPSAYSSFKAPQAPWKVCFADSFEGNPWRVSLKNELQRMSDQFKAAGKVSGLEVSVSGGDVSRQIAQIHDFIDKGCSVILTIPESATGINDAVKAAHDKGIPVVTLAGAVTSPDAINVDSNYYLWGQQMAQGISKQLGGKGNVLMVEGISGQPVAVAENQGAKDAFKSASGIHVVGEVNGNWTPSTTKSAVLQALATHPQKIDAVWSTGSESKEIADAFTQAGRPLPLITASISGDALGYWHQHKGQFKFYGNAVLPSWTAQTAFRVAIRMLEGQQPKLNTLMIPLPQVTTDTLGNWYKPCMTPDSASVFPVAPSDPMPEDQMNGYFTNGSATPPYDYAQPPDPGAS
jgi:ribose transport system substrate-binding protein